MKGKTTRIYLGDGTPTGTLTAEIMNWTGKVVVVPSGHGRGVTVSVKARDNDVRVMRRSGPLRGA